MTALQRVGDAASSVRQYPIALAHHEAALALLAIRPGRQGTRYWPWRATLHATVARDCTRLFRFDDALAQVAVDGVAA